MGDKSQEIVRKSLQQNEENFIKLIQDLKVRMDKLKQEYDFKFVTLKNEKDALIGQHQVALNGMKRTMDDAITNIKFKFIRLSRQSKRYQLQIETMKSAKLKISGKLENLHSTSKDYGSKLAAKDQAIEDLK